MLILKTITMMRDSVRFIISYVLVAIIIGSLLSSCGNKIETEQYRASPELAECFINLNGNTAGLSDDNIAGFEDYRIPAGVMENDTLRITLVARAAEWHPWGEDGPAIYTHAVCFGWRSSEDSGTTYPVHGRNVGSGYCSKHLTGYTCDPGVA
jgi:hypothetical protein